MLNEVSSANIYSLSCFMKLLSNALTQNKSEAVNFKQFQGYQTGLSVTQGFAVIHRRIQSIENCKF